MQRGGRRYVIYTTSIVCWKSLPSYQIKIYFLNFEIIIIIAKRPVYIFSFLLLKASDFWWALFLDVAKWVVREWFELLNRGIDRVTRQFHALVFLWLCCRSIVLSLSSLLKCVRLELRVSACKIRRALYTADKRPACVCVCVCTVFLPGFVIRHCV